MRYVVLPQAVRAMIPPTVSLAVGQLQVSSLISIIGVVELTKVGTNLNLRTLAPFTIWPIVALGYFVVSKPLSMLADWTEAPPRQHIAARRSLGAEGIRLIEHRARRQVLRRGGGAERHLRDALPTARWSRSSARAAAARAR